MAKKGEARERITLALLVVKKKIIVLKKIKEIQLNV